jgi:hypothetical protein
VEESAMKITQRLRAKKLDTNDLKKVDGGRGYMCGNNQHCSCCGFFWADIPGTWTWGYNRSCPYCGASV